MALEYCVLMGGAPHPVLTGKSTPSRPHGEEHLILSSRGRALPFRPYGWSTPFCPHRVEHPILSSRGGAPHLILTCWSTPSRPHRVEHPIPSTQVEHPISAGRVAGAPAQSLIQESQSLHRGACMTWSLSEALTPPTSFTACEVPLSGVWKRYSSHG